jgi:serine O-acetyltransferase
MKKHNNFENIVDQLSDLNMYNELYHIPWHEMDLPSTIELQKLVDILREIIFPGYFGDSKVRAETINYIIGARIHLVYSILSKQINRGFCFYCTDASDECADCKQKSRRLSREFISRLPLIKQKLALDAKAAFNGDPANPHISEAIFCYPSMAAITYHRIAHELIQLGVPLIPRIISEIAHSLTGIDIHPGAVIGEGFFIDHGTGVVIGETSIIGNNVRIYQGVTLGAKSFPLNAQGNPVKGIQRHPIVEDDVIIYANATILGRITIGKGAVIGGNVWVSEDVPPGTKVLLNITS